MKNKKKKKGKRRKRRHGRSLGGVGEELNTKVLTVVKSKAYRVELGSNHSRCCLVALRVWPGGHC